MVWYTPLCLTHLRVHQLEVHPLALLCRFLLKLSRTATHLLQLHLQSFNLCTHEINIHPMLQLYMKRFSDYKVHINMYVTAPLPPHSYTVMHGQVKQYSWSVSTITIKLDLLAIQLLKQLYKFLPLSWVVISSDQAHHTHVYQEPGYNANTYMSAHWPLLGVYHGAPQLSCGLSWRWSYKCQYESQV